MYEQKLAAGDMDAIKVLRSVSPVAWRNVHLIGAFDFTPARSSVDIEALTARFSDPEFRRRSIKEEDDEGP